MYPSNRAENYKNLHLSVPNSDGKVIDAESEKISQVASQLRVNNDATFLSLEGMITKIICSFCK